MKLLGEDIRRFGLRGYQYADNIQLYFILPYDTKRALEIFTWYWEEIMGWMRAKNEAQS